MDRAVHLLKGSYVQTLTSGTLPDTPQVYLGQGRRPRAICLGACGDSSRSRPPDGTYPSRRPDFPILRVQNASRFRLLVQGRPLLSNQTLHTGMHMGTLADVSLLIE